MTINYQFFQIYWDIPIFIYGTTFYSMGLGILLKNHVYSNFRLAKNLHWLALFGIVHAIADWGHLLTPIHKGYTGEHIYTTFSVIHLITIALSFTFLFQFGMSLLLDTKKVCHRLKYIPALMFILWFASMILYRLFVAEGDESWVRVGEIWARYTMAIPGGILSGYAIIKQKEEFIKYGQIKFIKMLKLAFVSLVFFGGAAGLIVPKGPIGLAEVINAESLFSLIGVPIEMIRAGVVLLVAVSILRIIQVFDNEYISRIQASEKDKAISEERNRIAQDLHDGIIQSIYATNLQLEVAKHLIATNPAEALNKLSVSLSQRNEIINQIRQYIGELKRVHETNVSLKERIDDLIDELGLREKLNVKFLYSYEERELPITVLYHVSLVLKEALANVIKHAGAKELSLKVSGDSAKLNVQVSDDGVGFLLSMHSIPEPGEKQGLKNMRERVKALNGEIVINSAKKKGTTISIRIPILGGSRDNAVDS